MLKAIAGFFNRYIMIVTLAVLVCTASLISPSFLTPHNLWNILRQVSAVGCVALGMTYVLVGGTFDMSVGSTVSLAGVLSIGLQPHIGVIPAVGAALFLGVLIGFLNGSIIVAIKSNQGDSFIITFGMLSMIQAIALIYSNGNTIPGSNNAAYNFIGNGELGNVPVSILIFLGLAAILQVFLTRTTGGRRIYYIGANIEAARLAGIRVGFYKLLTYVVSGFCSAVAAVILTARVNGAAPTIGLNYEFDAVTAIVIGGIGLAGGEGSIAHAVIGVLIMGVISNGMNIVGLTPQSQFVAKGLILIAAVCVRRLRSSRKVGGITR
jgi:ribose/xylose/arabinose/galactoside ABC-type transport system permease subunit